MMRRMLLMALGLMLVCAAPAFAQKMKVKNKDKRFETVVRQESSDYAGRYAGFESGYYIEVGVDTAGNLQVTSFEGTRQARLENIRLSGAKLTATKIYEDGTRMPFTATFANRILNGVSDFGMIIEGDVTIAPTVTVNRIFYKKY